MSIIYNIVYFVNNKLTILFPDSIQYLLSGENTIKNNRAVTIPAQINSHISEKEIEILEAFRKLDQKKQKFYYHQILADAAQAEIEADETNGILLEDAKSAV